MATIRQTLEQQRAAGAWTHIEAVKDENVQKKYGTLARKLPTMIQSNGLGTTLAFLLAKGKEEHKLIYSHLSQWVGACLQTSTSKEFVNLLERVQNQKTPLMDLVRQGDMSLYRRATSEAIEYGIWLKRYVEAKDWGSVEGDES